MCLSVRVFDDGAWISVDGDRVVGVADVWKLDGIDFCGCEPADFLVEAYTDAWVEDGAKDENGTESETHVLADPVGRCLDCGTHGTPGSLLVGTVVDGAFERVVPPRPADSDGRTQ